ncbi:unnamed protein product [Rhizophagus irregularis]|nr:unnamed protein product [Rhizophagus irregularis]
MFRQVWIGGKVSFVIVYFVTKLNFGSALDIWVSASSSWTLDGFSFQFLNFEYIDLGFWFLGVKFSFWFLGVEYIGSAFGFDFQFLDVCYWFRLSVLGHLLLLSVLIYRFRLSVLGHLIYRFRLFVLGCLICSSYAFDLKLSVVNCNILGLWIGNGCDISLGFGSVSAVISLGIEMFQLRYLWIWKSAPESQ